MLIKLLALLGLLCVGGLIGWLHAHTVIARECERLGGFYVGDRKFRCLETSSVTAPPAKGAPQAANPDGQTQTDDGNPSPSFADHQL